MSLSLADVTEIRDAYAAAVKAVALNQSYTIGTTTYTRADAATLDGLLVKWNRRVAEFDIDANDSNAAYSVATWD